MKGYHWTRPIDGITYMYRGRSWRKGTITGSIERKGLGFELYAWNRYVGYMPAKTSAASIYARAIIEGEVVKRRVHFVPAMGVR